MNKRPPYKDPSEAIQYIKDNFVSPIDNSNPSWQGVAVAVSAKMYGETSKAVMWNVAHKKYKCPPDVAAALREMGLLRSTKRWRFFLEVENEEEYKLFKKMLGDKTLKQWVWKHVGTNW